MIYTTNFLTEDQKELLKAFNLKTVKDKFPTDVTPCLILDYEFNLYFLFQTYDDETGKPDGVRYYTYHTNNPDIPGYNPDIVEYTEDSIPKTHMLHHMSILDNIPILLTFPKVTLYDPESYPIHELKDKYEEAYQALTAIGFFATEEEPDTFKNIIQTLLDNILSSEEETLTPAAADLIAKLKEKSSKGYEFTKPDIFYIMTVFPIREVLNLAAKAFHDNVYDTVMDKDKPNFIFIHYDYLEHNIVKLLEAVTHTSSCEADISRFLLEYYLRYAITGETPAFPERIPANYHVPKFGTEQQWINYLEGLYYLYYGQPERYLTAYTSIANSYTANNYTRKEKP